MVLDLDANATYTPSQSFQEVVSSAWKKLGNPSSIHRGGQRARAAVEEAREQVRALVGAGSKDQVIFTSGATEANNMVVASAAKAGAHLLSSTIEHPCVLEPLRKAAQSGSSVSLAPASAGGEVAAQSIAVLLRGATSLVSVMAANNETGVVNDVCEIGACVRRGAPKALIHTDAAQIVGKMPLRFAELPVDLLTISGHKLGALSGVGALIMRPGVTIAPLLLGGPQESKLRGGTENVLGIISLGIAASDILSQGAVRGTTMEQVRDAFEQELLTQLPECEINGRSLRRLPNTASVFIPGVRADDLLVALDLEGIYVSSGAACSSGKPEPSHVLLAMGQSEERVRSTIRVSFRADQEWQVGRIVAQKLSEVVTRMRSNR
jgi:cysteine desulfurase